MLSLLAIISNTFSRDLTSHLAARLGEGENSINKALNGAVPVVLVRLIDKANSGEARLVYDLSQDAHRAARSGFGTVTEVLGTLGAGCGPGSALRRGENTLTALFDTPAVTIAGLVSSQAGIKLASASTLLGMVGAVLPALLGQYAAQHRLQAGGLAAVLLSHRQRVRALLPRGEAGPANWPGLGPAVPRLIVKSWFAAVGLRRRGPVVAATARYQVTLSEFADVLTYFLSDRRLAQAGPVSWRIEARHGAESAAVAASEAPAATPAVAGPEAWW